jgi:hypothetical protein
VNSLFAKGGTGRRAADFEGGPRIFLNAPIFEDSYLGKFSKKGRGRKTSLI